MMKRIMAKKRSSMGVFFLNTLGPLHCLALRKFPPIPSHKFSAIVGDNHCLQTN
jgi:hypothetical protein